MSRRKCARSCGCRQLRESKLSQTRVSRKAFGPARVCTRDPSHGADAMQRTTQNSTPRPYRCYVRNHGVAYRENQRVKPGRVAGKHPVAHARSVRVVESGLQGGPLRYAFGYPSPRHLQNHAHEICRPRARQWCDPLRKQGKARGVSRMRYP